MSDIGWTTSIDGGRTRTHGSLPGIPTVERSGPYDRASDPAVPFDAAHNVWLMAALPIALTSPTRAAVVSRSSDGGFTRHCYVEWDNPFIGDEIFMSTSTDGGVTCLQRRLQIQRPGWKDRRLCCLSMQKWRCNLELSTNYNLT